MSENILTPNRLPPEALMRYLSYKRNTKIIIGWLVERGQACGFNFQHSPRPTVRELGEAALGILRSGSLIPRELYWPFKNAICDRKYLKVHYQDSGQDASNSAHDFFLDGLIRIFRSFFPLKAKKTPAETKYSSRIEDDVIIKPNPYALLETLIDDGNSSTSSDLDMQTDIPDDDEDSIQEEAKYGERQSFEDLIFVLRLHAHRVIGEEMGISNFPVIKLWTVDFMRHIMEYDEVMNLINSYWEKCRDGSMRLITATLLTNSAVRLMKRFRASRSKLGVTGHDDFVGRMRGLLSAIDVHLLTSLDYKDAKRDVFFNGSGFILPWYQLIESREDPWKLCGPVEKVRLSERLSSFKGSEAKLAFESFPDWKQFCTSNQRYMTGIFKSITQVMEIHNREDSEPYRSWIRERSTCNHSWFHPYRLPLCGEVDDCLKASTDSILTTTVFGLQAMLESSRTYTWHPSGSVNKSNPRIMALQLAGSVKKSLDRMLALPTLYPKSAGLYYPKLHEFSNGLQQFLSENRFDVYYQSPWVAGSQMLQVWRAAFYYGIYMCNDSGFIPAILHLFNVLVQKKRLKEKDYPILSGLCSGLEPVWGWSTVDRPTKNFRSSFAVVVCGSIPKDGAGKREHRQRQKVQVPDNYPCAFDPDVRILPPKWFTWSYDNEDSRLYHEFHCRLLGLSPSTTSADQSEALYLQRLCAVDVRPSESATQNLLRTCTMTQRPVLAAVEKDFYAGIMPASRTDWFAVYALCTDALAKFTAAARDPDLGITFVERVLDESTGVDLAVMLFNHVDEHDEVGKRLNSRSKRREEGLFEAACKALEAIFKDKKPEDYLWDM